MAFFNEFKEIFNKAAHSVTSKTREGIEITRLSSESRGLANEIAMLHGQIGRLYVESKGADEQSLSSLCARVEELQARLEELDRQKQLLKNQNRCPACGSGMPRNARFCSNCGRRMPEAAAEPEAAPSAEDVTYCPECGAMRRDGDSFCAVCGHGFEPESEPGDEPAPSRMITRPIITRTIVIPAAEDSSDEAPTDFEAD